MLWSNSIFSRTGTFCSGSRGALSAFAAFPPLASPLPPLSERSAFAALAWSASAGFCGRFDCSGAAPEPRTCLSSVSAIDLNSGTLGDAHLLAVFALADELEADARRLAVLRVGQG